jgi:hypothetical protein
MKLVFKAVFSASMIFRLIYYDRDAELETLIDFSNFAKKQGSNERFLTKTNRFQALTRAPTFMCFADQQSAARHRPLVYLHTYYLSNYGCNCLVQAIVTCPAHFIISRLLFAV